MNLQPPPQRPCPRYLAKWFAYRALFTAAALMLIAGCAQLPNTRALIYSRLYRKSPRFVGTEGPLTQAQGKEILARLESHQVQETDILERHLAFEQAITGSPLTLGNEAILLENGNETYRAMFQAIAGARTNINIEMFTFADDPSGKRFADALVAARHRGVNVNLIYDSMGSLATPASFFDRMRSTGINVREFNPLDPFAGGHRSFTHRDHRKLLVVDGRTAITGGVNVTDAYTKGFWEIGHGAGSMPLDYWRDTDVEITGPAVSEFQSLFIAEWRRLNGPPLNPRDYYPIHAREGNQIVRVIGSIPREISLIYLTLLSAIDNAETSVYITDAYFAPDRQMLTALKDAARRGVDVRLLLPGRSDQQLVVEDARSHYASLLQAGVKIYEWQGTMLHAKTAVIDGVWSTIGTSNLDWWSIARDNEINAVILSHSFGREMAEMFQADMAHSKEILPAQWDDRGVSERLEEAAAHMMEPLL